MEGCRTCPRRRGKRHAKETVTFLLILFALLVSLAPAFIAYGKGRNFLFWWLYGVVLGPIAMIYAIMLRDRARPELETASSWRVERSGSYWPFLLRVSCLFPIIIIAVAGYRMLIPSYVNSTMEGGVVSSDGTPPQLSAAAPNNVRPSARAKSTKVISRPSTSIEEPVVSGLPSDGKIVLSVQQALKIRGYDPGPADGLAGQQTKQAIRKFQADRGFSPSGGIDHSLLQALDIGKERN